MTDNFDIATRNAKREDCRIFGTVSYFGQKAKGRIVNLSATGISLELHEALSVPAGGRIALASPELGHIEGTVRWLQNGRVGIEFKLNSNALAQVSSYFRFFHQELKPVLTR